MTVEAKISPQDEGLQESVKMSQPDLLSEKKKRLYRAKSTSTLSVDGGDPENEQDQLIIEEEEEEKDLIEAYRVATKKFLASTATGQFYENVLLALSVMSSLEFIYQTYLDLSIDIETIAVLNYVEQVLAVLFTLDWFLNLFLAEHRILYISSFYSLIDLLSVVPIWVSAYSYVPNYYAIASVRDGVVYLLCALATTRILRALRIRKKLIVLEDEVQRCVGEIILQLLVMILFFSALIQYLEADEQKFEFHTFMYFIVVTITTVGYGDISCRTTPGRFAIMCMIFTGVGLIPQMTTRLIETSARQSVYARANFHPKGKASTHSHVVICGELGSLALSEFFAELFHEDHENLNLHAVVLCQNSPSHEMGLLMRDPVYSMDITYLEGTALSQHDLKRASAWMAVSIFILTNKFSSKPDEEDAKVILQQFSIKQHITALADARLRAIPLICIQIVRPENRRHLIQNDPDDDDEKKDLVMCLNELKMGVIAKAVMFPGTNTLIMNLLTSFADDEDDSSAGKGEDQSEIDNLNSEDADHWMFEYQRGCDWEIYTTELSDKFEGATFIRLSEMLYQRLGIVLFALQIEDLQKEKSNIRVLLNPAEFVIPSKADFKIDAFVIAKNANQSDLTFSGEQQNDVVKDQDSAFLKGHSGLDRKTSLEADMMKRSFSSDQLLPKKVYPWQKMLRKYESSKHGAGSEQELMQKVEDAYLRENYFTLPHRPMISSCMIHTSLDEEFPHIHNHTLIIGKSLTSIYDLIKNLRAKYLEILRHIVILTPTEVPHHVWARINIFKCVLVLRGSPLEETDILRAGIFKAQQVIVLADSNTNASHDSNEAGSVALLDADAVFAYQCVKRLNESCSCVVEIVRSQNVGYLDPQGVVKTGGSVDYKFTPQFASGALFTTSLLDTLVCQAFYNPKIISVIAALFSGVERKSKKDIESDLRGDEQVVKRGVGAIQGSTLYQINMPELGNRTYGHLFKHLTAQGIIPIGLYRGIFPHMQIGPKQNKSSYCYCNPTKDTELFSCDKVFVLSPKPLLVSSKKNVMLAEAAMNRSHTLHGMYPEHDMKMKMNELEQKLFERITQMETTIHVGLGALRNQGENQSIPTLSPQLSEQIALVGVGSSASN